MARYIELPHGPFPPRPRHQILAPPSSHGAGESMNSFLFLSLLTPCLVPSANAVQAVIRRQAKIAEGLMKRLSLYSRVTPPINVIEVLVDRSRVVFWPALRVGCDILIGVLLQPVGA